MTDPSSTTCVRTAVVIDDSPDLRHLAQVFLQRAGYAVAGESCDPVDGLEVVARLQPDVVVVEVDLPAPLGQEVLPMVRRLSPRSKVVSFTSPLPWRLEPPHRPGLSPDATVVKAAGSLRRLVSAVDALWA